jgi:hypothetical protein
MDVPGRDRPLADSGSDGRAGVPRRPYPDGGDARSPAELLDELRLRLRQLPDNHPSARAGQDDRRPSAEFEPDEHESAELERPEVESAGVERSEVEPAEGELGEVEPAEGELGEREPGEVAGGTADPARAARTGGDAGRSLGGLLDRLRDLDAAGQLPDLAGWTSGELDLSWPRHPETYRPWFMSGDPSAPWFASDSDPSP